MYKLALFAGLALVSCKKDKTELVSPIEKPHPRMVYHDLKDTSVVFNRSASYDLDGNGSRDIYFSTLHVGDPSLQQDKKQWLVSTAFHASLPVNAEENIPVLHLQDSIPPGTFQGYEWFNASSVVLAEKIIPEGSLPFWQGNWKQAIHKFIPVQVLKNDGIYNGWVEISFSRNAEKLILHRAGISAEANKTIRAGK